MNLQAGFEDTLPGGPVPRLMRLVLAYRRRVIVVWVLPLAVGIFAPGQFAKRLPIDFPEPGDGRSAA